MFSLGTSFTLAWRVKPEPNLQESVSKCVKVRTVLHWLVISFSLVFEVLDAAQAFELSIDHDGQSSTQSLTLLHAVYTRIHFITCILMYMQNYNTIFLNNRNT